MRFIVCCSVLAAVAFASGCGNSASTCGPSNCAGCCDSSGICQAGNETGRCGVTGATCSACAAGQSCTNGACLGGPGGGAGGGGGGAGGGGGSTANCAYPLIPCGDRCVDRDTDLLNCGACNRACGNTQACVSGICQLLPSDCTQTPCPSGYYCTSAKSCAKGCNANGDCPQPGACTTASHVCACQSGTHLCGSTCVSDGNAAQCGASCVQCTAPENASPLCSNGSCSWACNAGYHDCGGTCVPNNSVNTCGSSCSACPIPANSAPTCNGTSCGFTCGNGFHKCGNGCGANTSVNSCGSSCTACPVPANSTATCDGTSCGFICKSGFHECNGACVSDTDVNSCGSRCTPCYTYPNSTPTCDGYFCDFTCNAGAHVCQPGTINKYCLANDSVDGCGPTSCTPCPTDPHGSRTCTNGSCGITCNAGYLMCSGACAACPTTNATTFGCNGAACEATACATGNHLCGGACVSDTSLNSCGSSCTACPTVPNSQTTCDGTSCGFTCNAGRTNCSGTCVLTGSDPLNCGACGNVCGAGEACSAGRCVTTCAGTFSFGTPTYVDAGAKAMDVAVGDYDEDGIPDLWVDVAPMVSNNGWIYFLPGLGNGGFGGSQLGINTGANTVSGMLPLDVNGDGHLDVALIRNLSYGRAFGMYGGGGDGGLISITPPALADDVAWFLMNDFTNDGRRDLLLGGPDGGTSRLFAALDGGGFSASGVNSAVTNGVRPVPAYFDLDRTLDLAWTAASGGSYLGLGNGTGQFPIYGFPSFSTVYAYASGDVNGDGLEDILVANSFAMGWVFGRGDGSTQYGAKTYSLPRSPNGLVVGDLDGDGKLDVILGSNSAGSAFRLEALGDGGFADAGQIALLTNSNSSRIQLVNANGDQWPDLAVIDSINGRLEILPGVCQ